MILELDPKVRSKTCGNDGRLEYNVLNKAWSILTGYGRPGFIPESDKSLPQKSFSINLPTRCKGKPLRIASDQFEEYELRFLYKHNVWFIISILFIVYSL